MNKFECTNHTCRFIPDRNLYSYSWNSPFAFEELFNRTLEWLKSKGFKVEMDPDVLKNYPSIAKLHYKISKGKFYYRTKIYPNGFEFEFLEENLDSCRGYNCWDNEFSYLARVFKKHMKNEFYNFWIGLCPSAEHKIEVEYKTSEQKIINHFRENCWHKPDTKNEDFTLSMWDGTTEKYEYNSKDRDGKTIYNGEIKYFYNCHGYLSRGKVYHNINNMWWVICNNKLYYNIVCFDLFDLTDNDLKHRRNKKEYKPKKYLDLLPKESPENQIRKILDSKITPRKLGQLFAEYFEGRCIEQRNYKLKKVPEQWYYVEGKCWSWNKVACEFCGLEENFQITFRQENYIIVRLNEKRIFELDSRILHWDKEALAACFQKYNNLFKKILGSIDRMHA